MLFSSRNIPQLDSEAIGLTNARTGVPRLVGQAIGRAGSKLKSSTLAGAAFVRRGFKSQPKVEQTTQEPTTEEQTAVREQPSQPANWKLKWARRYFTPYGSRTLAFSNHPGLKGVGGMRGDVNHWEQQLRYWSSRGLNLAAFPKKVADTVAHGTIIDLLLPGIGYFISLPINTFYAIRAYAHRDRLTGIVLAANAGRYRTTDPERQAANEWIINQFLPYAISQKTWQLSRRGIAMMPIPFLGAYQFARGAGNRLTKMYIYKNQGAVRRAMAGELARELLEHDNPLARDIVQALYGRTRLQALLEVDHKLATGALYERLNSTGTDDPSKAIPGGRQGRCAQCAVAKALGISAQQLREQTGRPPGADNALELLQQLASAPPRMALFASWESAHAFMQNTRPATDFVVTYRYRLPDATGRLVTQAHTLNVSHEAGQVRVSHAQMDDERGGDRSFVLTPSLNGAPSPLKPSLDTTFGIEVIPTSELDQFTPPRSPTDVILNGEQLGQDGQQRAVMQAFGPQQARDDVTWSQFQDAVAEVFGLRQPVATFDHRSAPSARSRNVPLSFAPSRGARAAHSRAQQSQLLSEALTQARQVLDAAIAPSETSAAPTPPSSPTPTPADHVSDRFATLVRPARMEQGAFRHHRPVSCGN
jgi:hypothetical protein